jgi:uncharacterized protein YjiS (DUF1127 family)
VNLLQDSLRLWALHREFRTVYAELSRLSDRELDDMGIARGDIAGLAYDEAERRIVTPPRPGTRPVRQAGRPVLMLAHGGAR